MNPQEIERIIFKRYPDAKLIKTGGQKAVFLIKHPKYGQSVLKIGECTTPKSLERISREVNTLREIDSPYYPKNYEFEIFDKNKFLIIEQYVDSKTLTDCMSNFFRPLQALSLLSELVNGLNILWDKQIVHRDIKPDNLLITTTGKVIIIDLGIARLLLLESVTESNLPSGPATPNYAAPEQLKNRKAMIDPRTDQFNLGIVTLQLLLKGKHPFDPRVVGEGSSIVENILAGRYHSEIFDDKEYLPMKPLIVKLLGSEPFMRFRNIDTLIELIKQTAGEMK